MYVRYVARDEPRGESIGTRTAEYEDPSWEDIKSFIEELDGEKKTYVMIAPSSDEAAEQLFLVRAAERGMYVCEAYDGDQYLLINPHGGPLKEPLYVGEFAFDSTWDFVGLADAIAAAKTYFEYGTRDSTFTWLSDGI